MLSSANTLSGLKSTFSWLLVLAFFTTGRSQTANSDNYHIDIQKIDGRFGLESVIIRTIHQDKKGFIWISTPNGLARFNGIEILYYKNPKLLGTINTGIDIVGDLGGKILVAENVIDISRDSSNNQSQEHYYIYLLDPASGKIIPFSASIGKNFPFNIRKIHTLACKDEILYVGLKDGRVYTYSKGKWYSFYANPSKDPIRKILVDRPDRPFWVLAGDTLKCISWEGKCLDKQFIDPKGKVWNIELDNQGSVWLNSSLPGYGNGTTYKTPEKPLQQYHPRYGDIGKFQSVKFDNAGRGWFWKINKFVLFDPDGKKMAEIPAQTSLNNLPKIYFDQKNRAWISLRQQFVTVRIAKKQFQQFLNDKSISARQMVEVKPGVIWAATYDGLFQLSTSGADLKFIPLPSFHQFGVCKDGLYVWIGLHGEYILRVDSRNGKWEKWPVAGLSEVKKASLHLLNPFLDKEGNIWVGSNFGLYKADTLRRVVYGDPRFNTHGLEECQITYQWQNEEGIWTTTNQGLFLVDPRRGVKKVFKELSGYNLSYLHEKPKGVFWIATRGHGLLKWERNSGRITRFGPEQGIINPNLHTIFEDPKGRFWMPTDRGLVYFDPQTRFVHTFFESDGLTNDEFNRRSYLKLSDGSFLFGGISGINRLNPLDFDEFDRPPTRLHITDYDVWDPDLRRFVSKTSELLQAKKITLGARQISFQIKFALLDYDKLAENRYAYKIDGMDKDWILIRENYLRFTSLPHGKFTLRIKGAPSKGGWAPDELSIPIEVKRPVYLKGWFFVICGLFLLTAVWGAFRWRLYRLGKIKLLLENEVAARTRELERDRQTIAQQNQELEALNQTKDHLMAVIGHELRGPMLSIQSIGDNINYLLKNGQEAKAAALGEHIKHRMFSIRMLLDNLLYWGLSQAGKQEVFRETVPLHALIVEAVELVEFWIASKKLHLSISCPPELNLFTDRNILRMVLLNLLTNAIKFTPEEGTICLNAGQHPDYNYFIEVSDSGTGMNREEFSRIKTGSLRSTPGTKGEKGTGMGLALSMKLLDSLKGQLALDAQSGNGCTFRIVLPAQEIHTS